MRLARLAALAALVSLLLPAGDTFARGRRHVNAIPPHAHAFGTTYAELAAQWWSWALSMPEEVSPVVDTTGEFCAVGQSGKVWFLAGTSFSSLVAPVVRECAIPTGTALFLPLFTVAYHNEGEEDLTGEEMALVLDMIMSWTCELRLTLDGRELRRPFSYRATTKAFALTAGEGNYSGWLPEEHYPVVVDGYWVLLPPLSRGEHVLHFYAALCDTETGEAFFGVDVTYHLTVERRARHRGHGHAHGHLFHRALRYLGR